MATTRDVPFGGTSAFTTARCSPWRRTRRRLRRSPRAPGVLVALQALGEHAQRDQRRGAVLAPARPRRRARGAGRSGRGGPRAAEHVLEVLERGTIGLMSRSATAGRRTRADSAAPCRACAARAGPRRACRVDRGAHLHHPPVDAAVRRPATRAIGCAASGPLASSDSTVGCEQRGPVLAQMRA